MSLFLQYQLAQTLGDLGGGGGTVGAAAGAGFGLAAGLMMPPLIWRAMAPHGYGVWGPAAPFAAPAVPRVGALQPRFCGHCGAPLVNAARFCGHCGTAAAR